MKYDISEIGQTIKSLYDKKTSQAKFAEKIGVWDATVSKWVANKSVPTLMSLLVICDEYDMKITDFLKPIGEDK